MRWFMYAVYDTAAGVYDRPFVGRSDGEAVRSFQDIANDKEHPIGKHPEHYSLHSVGVYDDNTGDIDPKDRKCIARAHELVKVVEEYPSPGLVNDGRDVEVPLNAGGSA